MRISSFAPVAAIVLGVALAGTTQAVAQSEESAPVNHKIFGYQDTQTGTFHPLAVAVPEATIAPITGAIDVTFTITLKSTFAKGSAIACSTAVVATSVAATTGTLLTYTEEATGSTTVNGTTATCTANLPYSWLFPPASTTVLNNMSASYTVEVAGTSTTVTFPTALRLSGSQLLPQTKIPATGTTLKYAVNVTL